jgi:hypothetical protein
MSALHGSIVLLCTRSSLGVTRYYYFHYQTYSKDPQLFKVILHRNISKRFPGILGDMSHVQPDPRKVVTSIVLGYNSDGSQGSYLAAEDLSECSISFLGRLTNIQVLVLPGN